MEENPAEMGIDEPIQIGQKLRNNTTHGGCFYNENILVARPNLKIFNFDLHNLVVDKTLSFKDNLPEMLEKSDIFSKF